MWRCAKRKQKHNAVICKRTDFFNLRFSLVHLFIPLTVNTAVVRWLFIIHLAYCRCICINVLANKRMEKLRAWTQTGTLGHFDFFTSCLLCVICYVLFVFIGRWSDDTVFPPLFFKSDKFNSLQKYLSCQNHLCL